MALVARDGRPFRFSTASWWAGSWALGVALGVALGGYLTVTSGAGAPGEASLDIGTDVFLLPGIAALAVFSIHLLAQVVRGAVRGRRTLEKTTSD